MIGSIAGWLVTQGISAKIAKPLVYGALILLAIGLFFGAKAAYDAHVISTNDAQVVAQSEAANRKADAKAADARVTDQQRRDAEAAQLSATLNMEAPDATRDPASVRAAQRAFYRCLHQQREAREAGRPSASCGP